jgi:uncharacterized membrane protein YfcA
VKLAIFACLAGFALFHLATWLRSRGPASVPDVPPEANDTRPPTSQQLAIGFITNFFDTLGIGSFAPTTSIFKFTRMVPDRLIPGTMNVGDTAPTITQAFIFIAIVVVDPLTLVTLVGAAVAGAWQGAGIVSGWSKQNVQRGMGVALLAAAILLLVTNWHIGPAGGAARALTGTKLAIGIAGNFVLGVLMTLGIGLYGPCLIMISLLGMDPLAGFPIMMGSCAFLMPISSARFVARRCYSRRPALGLALGGIPAVLMAAYIVKSLPLAAVRWLVIVVVLYTASVMLRAGFAKEAGET